MVNELRKNMRGIITSIFRDIKELMDAAEEKGGFDAMELNTRQSEHWSKFDACFENYNERIEESKKKRLFGRS